MNFNLLKSLLFVGLLFSLSFGYSQVEIDCDSAVVAPTVLDGVTVTDTYTGSVSTYLTEFTSCGYTTPENSLHLGLSGSFSYTYLFSEAVNDLVIVITGTGTGADEEFTFTTSDGIPDIIDEGSCFTTIIGNTIYSGAAAGFGGGGGVFRISNPTGPYTSLTIEGPGGVAGSLFALCAASVIAIPYYEATAVTCPGDCDGSATVLDGDVPPYSYVWAPAAGGGTDATAEDLCAGVYWVRVTNGEGEIDTLEVTIPEPDPIEVDLEVTHLACYGDDDGEIEVIATGGTGDLTYDIGEGPVTDNEFEDLEAGDYTIIVTDENDCVFEIDTMVFEPDMIEVSLVSLFNISCFGESDGEFTVEAEGGVTPDYQYSIDGGVFTLDPEFTDLDVGTYEITARDLDGCEGTLTVEITEPELLVLDLVETTDVTCFDGADGAITVDASGGTLDYEYATDGVTFGISEVFTDLTAGAYTITVRDANGCETTVEASLDEPIPVSAIETITDEVCIGDCLGSITLEGTDGVGPYGYSVGGCELYDAAGTYSNLCAGDYDVCVIDNNGCVYTNTISVGVGDPYPDATISPIGPFCINDASVSLSAVSPGGVYSGPGVSFGSFNPADAGPGTHTITNIIYGDCGDTATLDVVVYTLPTVAFTPDVNSGCKPLPVFFTYTGDPGVDCTWNYGEGTVDFCGSIEYTYYNEGTFGVGLTVTDANGCTNGIYYEDLINVHPLPEASFRFSPQPATTIDTKINFTDLSYKDIDKWDWTFGSYGNSSDQNPSFIFPEIPGEYPVILVVEDENGCVDSTQQTVLISEQFLIYAPNTITPDGDAFNEVFKPYFNGIDIYNYQLTIYNRWGEIIFESHNTEIGWDGTYGGEIVEQGVYIWHIITDDILTDEKKEFHGHVTVVK